MQQQISLRLLPHEAADDTAIKKIIAASLAINENCITGFYCTRYSLDARGKQILAQLSLTVFIDEPVNERPKTKLILRDVSHAKKSAVIIGAGPAGLFAAIRLIEQGILPIVLERGKDVRARRRDLALLNKEGIINPESNYCFGEGGAGTYSDGKLYTRSTKRGDVNRILQLLVRFGADEKILYESHPHIGTNKLPQIITAMRRAVLDCGGKFLFEKKVTDFVIEKDEITSVQTADGDAFHADNFILATGHSARDIFILLKHKKIHLEAKPFALGIRIEHPQCIIDAAQYHLNTWLPNITRKNENIRPSLLPPASYSLKEQVNNRGVFSFCMCPGGIIAPAATNAGEIVVNGWSPSKRNNPFSNSGIVAQVEVKDIIQHFKKEKMPGDAADPLLLMNFQSAVEKKAYTAGGGKFAAPALRMIDFCSNKISSSLPACSYLPGIHSADMKDVLPAFIHSSLQQALKMFGKKMKGYYTNDAVVVATESRTSSPVRIPRDAHKLHHPQIKNLFPCGEGAGYAGGIVSAAMDGERVAAMVAEK